MEKEIKNSCCQECLSSKYALKGKTKEKFGGICGLTCDCHCPEVLPSIPEPKELSELLEEFDKKFTPKYNYFYRNTGEEIKLFLTKVYHSGRTAEKERIRKVVEGMKQSMPPRSNYKEEDQEAYWEYNRQITGYNQALADILNSLTGNGEGG